MGDQKSPVILHISDLHFGWDTTPQSENNRSLVLNEHGLLGEIADLSVNEPEWKPSVVCITGDIGGKGQASNYLLAEKWIQALLSMLELTVDNLFMCPGNHDAERAYAERLPRPSNAIEADCALKYPMEPYAHYLTEPFTAYTDFCARMAVPPFSIGNWENYLIGARSIPGSDASMICLNSAWFCKDGHDESKLWLGLELIKYLLGQKSLPDDAQFFEWPTAIVLVHHPEDWLHHDERSRQGTRPGTAGFLTDRCHILLSGHTHGDPVRPTPLRSRALHFPGGAAFAGDDHPNSFRLIRLEDEWLSYRIYQCTAGSGSYRWHKIVDGGVCDPRYVDKRLKPRQVQVETEQVVEVSLSDIAMIRDFGSRALQSLQKLLNDQGDSAAYAAKGELVQWLDAQETQLDDAIQRICFDGHMLLFDLESKRPDAAQAAYHLEKAKDAQRRQSK